MCGIVGFITQKAGDVPDISKLRAMRESLAHRGPDDLGEYVRPLDAHGPFVFLGHRRLSIIDLSGGHQPLSNEKKDVWVTFNGEIYNFKELKHELEILGHHFETLSDTEVIVHAYEEYQEACFRYFNGMFAIGIWDEPKKRLLLARDRLGKKPLYYGLPGNSILFASELKALLRYPGFPRKVDSLSLLKYLFFDYVPCPNTIYEDAKKLPPASYLIWSEGKAEVKEYWSLLQARETENKLSEQEAAGRILELLRIAVKRRLISDVPLGVFLSGGIDSSAIAALAQEINPGKVKTFSIGFEDPSFDESKYASLVARHLGTEHYQQTMTPQDLLNIVPGLPDILDEPMADASILPTYLLSRFTRQYVKVALGGDGGDELFAGYPTYLAHRLAAQYERFLGPVHPMILRLGNLLPVSDGNISFDFKVKRFLSGIGYPPGTRNSLWLGSFSFEDLENICSPEIFNHYDKTRLLEELTTYESSFYAKDPLTSIQYVDLKLYLQEGILVKVDRASMACSLEVRAPFLDDELVEFVMRLPFELKLKKFTSKYILKKAMKQSLPHEVLQRRKKGFGVPIAKWVKGPLKELCMDLLSPHRMREEGFFNPAYISTLLQDHLANRKDNRKQLWSLLVWELWLAHYHPC